MPRATLLKLCQYLPRSRALLLHTVHWSDFAGRQLRRAHDWRNAQRPWATRKRNSNQTGYKLCVLFLGCKTVHAWFPRVADDVWHAAWTWKSSTLGSMAGINNRETTFGKSWLASAHGGFRSRSPCPCIAFSPQFQCCKITHHRPPSIWNRDKTLVRPILRCQKAKGICQGNIPTLKLKGWRENRLSTCALKT